MFTQVHRRVLEFAPLALATSQTIARSCRYSATSFYEGSSSDQRLTGSPLFLQAVNIVTLAPTATPNATHPVGGTPRTVEDRFSNTDPNDLSHSGSYSTYPQNIQPGYIQEFNLTAEYLITHPTSVQVGYIGETGQLI